MYRGFEWPKDRFFSLLGQHTGRLGPSQGTQIDVDSNLDIAGLHSDEDLINEAKRRRNNPECSEDKEESGDDEPDINLILALKVIRKYTQKSSMATEVMSLRNIERKIIVEKKQEAANKNY